VQQGILQFTVRCKEMVEVPSNLIHNVVQNFTFMYRKKKQQQFQLLGGEGINIQKVFTLKVLLHTYNLTYSNFIANIWKNNTHS
jgi:hypothetical protein